METVNQACRLLVTAPVSDLWTQVYLAVRVENDRETEKEAGAEAK